MGYALSMLQDRKLRLEQDLEGRRSHEQHLQGKIDKIREDLQAAGLALTEYASETSMLVSHIDDVERVIRLARQIESERPKAMGSDEDEGDPDDLFEDEEDEES